MMRRGATRGAWIGLAVMVVTATILAMSSSSRSATPLPDSSRADAPAAVRGAPRARDVRIQSGTAGVWLEGTLTMPSRPAPYPAVLLVSGAGPQDRDGTIRGHAMFRQIADHLSTAGWAVLRLDDRGTGGSGGSSETTTISMRADDMQAAWRYLNARETISRVGLIGHSEGATVSAMVAKREAVAFVVSLAGPGLPGHELTPLQVGHALDGTQPATAIRQLMDAQRRIAVAIAENRPEHEVIAEVRRGLETWNRLQPAAFKLSTAELDRRAARDGQTVSMPWYRSLIRIDPRDAWRGIRCPVLVLHGTEDRQVAIEPSVKELVEAASARGSSVTVRRLPGLDHLFTTPTRDAAPMLDAVSSWIEQER